MHRSNFGCIAGVLLGGFFWVSSYGATVGAAVAGRQVQESGSPIRLPSLGGPSEALAVNASGTAIAGYSWDRRDVLHAVKWTLQNGGWVISSLPLPSGATSAIARGIAEAGDVAGNDFPASTSRPVLWPAVGGVVVLGCLGDVDGVTVRAISAGGQVLAGQAAGVASVWRPGQCLEALPPLATESPSAAYAVNGDGTIVGGLAASAPQDPAGVPVRWRNIAGAWQIEQLDTLSGDAAGSNAAGDLAGHIVNPCTNPDGCARAMVWYAAGGSRQLGTLGGDQSWARDINATGEVVGGSASSIGNTGFFWSESSGMVQLAVKGKWAAANALSDVRPDGTRLVVGMDSQGRAIAWVLQIP